MKQFLLLMAVVGLATTGCAQNRVFGPQARRGGGSFQMARSQQTIQSDLPSGFQDTAFQEKENSSIKLAAFGDRLLRKKSSCTGCDCGCTMELECGCPEDGCCDCCSDGCCSVDGCCDDGCCGSDCCCDSGSCSSGCAGGKCGSGCSSCGGRGCGLCQRIAGRVASGFCGCNPHAGGYPASYNYNPSPPTGQVAYPYYTVRGPRDFLRNNPPSIGPY